MSQAYICLSQITTAMPRNDPIPPDCPNGPTCQKGVEPNCMFYKDGKGVQRQIFLEQGSLDKASEHLEKCEWDELAKFPVWGKFSTLTLSALDFINIIWICFSVLFLLLYWDFVACDIEQLTWMCVEDSESQQYKESDYFCCVHNKSEDEEQIGGDLNPQNISFSNL